MITDLARLRAEASTKRPSLSEAPEKDYYSRHHTAAKSALFNGVGRSFSLALRISWQFDESGWNRWWGWSCETATRSRDCRQCMAIYPTTTCNRGQRILHHTVDQFDEESFFHKLYVTKRYYKVTIH